MGLCTFPYILPDSAIKSAFDYEREQNRCARKTSMHKPTIKPRVIANHECLRGKLVYVLILRPEKNKSTCNFCIGFTCIYFDQDLIKVIDKALSVWGHTLKAFTR